MGSMSIWHWIVVIAVGLLLFGGRGKISELMGDFAKGIKSFKKGMAEDDTAQGRAAQDRPGKTIDHQAPPRPTATVPRQGGLKPAETRSEDRLPMDPDAPARSRHTGARVTRGCGLRRFESRPCSTSVGASCSSSAWSR